jgi:Flp pilus assembly protein TadG
MHARIRRIRNRWRSRRLLRLQRFTRDERGIQLVELAIVIPIFALLFAATAEFGRYFYEYTTLAKAARAGARYLSVMPTTAVDDSNAQKMVVYGNTDAIGPKILPDLELTHVRIIRQGGPTASVPETVTIVIEGYKHKPIFDLGKLTKSKLSTNVDVKPSVTMRYLLTQPPPI